MIGHYIFITGGVVSSLGKGIAAASLGSLLKAAGYRVKLKKIDPYLNVDSGTMSPFQHGEVFVTEDGKETDLDLGHYERFTGLSMQRGDQITAGSIYQKLLKRERDGDFLGKTVQVIPQVTDLIREEMAKSSEAIDFLIVEIGGTVGDMEGLPFYESIRQLKHRWGLPKVISLHLTFLPYLKAVGELKTKPTQHSVRALGNLGIQPDLLLCRAEEKIPEESLEKVAHFTGVDRSCVIPLEDQKEIYSIPLLLEKRGLAKEILKKAGKREQTPIDLSFWERVVLQQKERNKRAKISLIGKYNDLEDSYASLLEALDHGGLAHQAHIEIDWVDAEMAPKDLEKKLQNSSAILIPGGFGTRGVEGKIKAASYARLHHIPFLGICYGMQLAAISLARDLLHLPLAHTSEVKKTKDLIIGLLTEWQKESGAEKRDQKSPYGGTMRLGSYPCRLKKGTLAHRIYGKMDISERHRHRYEFNSNYRAAFEKAGVVISGTCQKGDLVEIIEYGAHPFFIGVQFHPEFLSRPFAPHPLFSAFIAEALKSQK